MKLQPKIALLLIPLVVVPLLLVGWIAYTQLRNTTERKSLDEMTTDMRQLERQMETLFQTTRANVGLFAESSLLQKYLLTIDETDRYTLMQGPLLRLFASYQHAYPDYYEIRVLLPDGYEDTRLAVEGLPNLREDESDTDIFKAMHQSPDDLYTGIFRNSDNHEISLLVSKRIKIRDDSKDPISSDPILRGYLALTVDLGFLDNELAQHWKQHHGILFFTDQKGKILFHSDSAMKQKVLPKELFYKLRTLSHSVKQSNTDREHLLKTDYRDKATLFMGQQIHKQLFLFALLPESELLAASRRLSLVVAVITLFAIVVSGGLLFALLRHMLVKPILHLSRITKEFGRGNLTLEIDIKTKDEVGELTQSFKEMSRNLQSSNEQIRYLAYHDNLTGLPNRLMFNDCLEHSLARARRSKMPLALLYIDLDNFKYINDTLGHHAGDELLKLTARRMRSSLRRGDHLARTEIEQDPQTVARVGGDEFAIILPCIKSPYAAASVAARLLESLSQPFRIVSQEIFVTASIGITTYPQDADNAEALVKNADVAMYHSKEQGKNIYQYYSESMNAAALERLTMENRLRRALERDELLLHYQPLVDVQTQKIVGVEALIRWHQPELGWIFPTEFIPLAEESGLIVPIGEWVIKTACKQLKQWLDSGIGHMRLSVNVSNQQFRRERLDSVIENILRETGLPPSHLEVELTESSIMRSEQTAEKVLTAIKRLGVSIALDDFGTGYSSLGYLRRFPIDTLKIDRSFVKDIVTDNDGAEILSAIIAMAQTLNLSVTAEGVEDIQQFEFLRSKGCDTIQGYLFSRPVPPEDIEMLLQQPVMLAS